MELPVLSPVEFIAAMAFGGIAMLLCVYIPVQVAAKCRRVHAARTRISCRICGYRFLRQEDGCRCPHCGAHNH